VQRTGVGWHEHHHDLFAGTERFFHPGYSANLISSWIPALDGVQAKLERGVRVADVGCGHGASTILMAQPFPTSAFTGFGYHDASIELRPLRGRPRPHALAEARPAASTVVQTPSRPVAECAAGAGRQLQDAERQISHRSSIIAEDRGPPRGHA
jgi:hypothetical protein